MKKTPEEIELGLHYCATTECADECPYKRDPDLNGNFCGNQLQLDALELIRHQRALIGDIKSELKHLYALVGGTVIGETEPETDQHGRK